jgi:hypothetical protein
LDCTADQCGKESSCNCTYAWGFENYKDPTLYAECKGEVEFPCDQAHDAKSYLYCHKVGGYTINEPTVPTEVDTCVEQSIDSCGSDDDLGKIQRTCEPNENKTCRTKGNGCETYYYKFGSLTNTPQSNSGSSGGAGCHTTGVDQGIVTGGCGVNNCVVAC